MDVTAVALARLTDHLTKHGFSLGRRRIKHDEPHHFSETIDLEPPGMAHVDEFPIARTVCLTLEIPDAVAHQLETTDLYVDLADELRTPVEMASKTADDTGWVLAAHRVMIEWRQREELRARQHWREQVETESLQPLDD